MTLEINQINKIALPYLEIRRWVKSAYDASWKKQWQNLTPNLTKFKPEPGTTAYANEIRSVQLPMSRIRLSAAKLTHHHYILKTDPKTCNLCKKRLNLSHLFIECPKYAEERKSLAGYCQDNQVDLNLSNISMPPFPADLIITFLRKTNMYQEI